jgi:sulfite reductase (NADPH) hemoprotein beta-component
MFPSAGEKVIFKLRLNRKHEASYLMLSLMSAEAPIKLSHNEEIKAAIPTLAGTIAATARRPGRRPFSEDDNQFLKFHGSYQQDDRDLRKTGKKYIMMIRGRIPGGVMTANQWRVFDDLATKYGNNTLRITTRQSIQFHGVVKAGICAARDQKSTSRCSPRSPRAAT